MKKILCLLLVFIMCLSFAGCNEKENSIVIAGDREIIDSSYFKLAVSVFKQKSNAEVTVLEFTDSSVKDPSVDIIIHPMDEKLTDSKLEGFYDMSHESWVNEIEGFCLENVIYDNKIYGFPIGQSQITGCFYNKDIFQKYNLEIPSAQNEFDTLCDTLAGKGIIPIYVAGYDVWPVKYELVLENALSKRVKFVDELNAGEITMAEIPGVSSMMDWWKMGTEKNWFGTEWYDSKIDEAAFHLGEGYAAMIICNDGWLYENLNGFQYNSNSFGLMPVFMGADSPFAVCSPLSAVCVKKESAETTTALDFVRTLADREAYNIYYEDVRTIPVLKHQNTINPPVQFAGFNTEYICSMSDFCGRLDNFDQEKGATAVMRYTKGEIGLEVALYELTNKKK